MGTILANLRVGVGITGSFCTFARVYYILKRLRAEGSALQFIYSERAYNTSTRFGTKEEWRQRFASLADRDPITTISEAEPIGPQGLLDVLVIAPCTGNTLAKLANAVTDSPVLMAAKAHLRNEEPLVVAVSTNDGLSGNAVNIGRLLNRRNIYFVPFGQDAPDAKPNSLVAKPELIPQTIAKAINGEQLQPVVVEYRD